MSTMTKIDKNILAVIRENVREAVRLEIVKMKAEFIPLVSKAEQNDIVKRYGKPTKKSVRFLRAKI